jgi:drug/metabolite transporter (DMT)-like permease
VAALVGLNVSASDFGAVLEVGLVALGYALGPAIIARQLREAPSVGVVAASIALTAIAYMPLGLTQLPATVPSVQVLGAVAGLGVICTALAFVLFFKLIVEAGPVRATVITYVNPAVAHVLGVVILSEPFTLGAAIGFLLILFGSVLSTRRNVAPGGAAVTEYGAASGE